MKTVLKVLCVVFALASVGHLVAGKIWFAGIVLAAVCGYFGFKQTTPSVAPVNRSGSKPSPAEQSSENESSTTPKSHSDGRAPIRLGNLELSPDTPPELLRAAQAMRSGDTETAVQMMMLHEDPANYYLTRGNDAAIWKDDHRAALNFFDQGIALGESEQLPYLYRGRALSKAELGDLEGAVHDLNEGLKLVGESKHGVMATFISNRAEVRRKAGDDAGAEIDERQAELLEQAAERSEKSSPPSSGEAG